MVDGIPARSLVLSSVLYVGLVLVFVVPQLADLMKLFMTHMSHVHRNPGEAWLLLSLPLLRLICLPLSYVVIGRRSALPARKANSILAAA